MLKLIFLKFLNFLGKIPILKEFEWFEWFEWFERFEWFEWFEWFGPSPTEPFNSVGDAAPGLVQGVGCSLERDGRVVREFAGPAAAGEFAALDIARHTLVERFDIQSYSDFSTK